MLNRSGVVHTFRQFPDGFAADGIDKVGRYLRKRLQDESAITELWMGNRQAGFINNTVTVKNDVDIECARFFLACSSSKVFRFDRPTRFE